MTRLSCALAGCCLLAALPCTAARAQSTSASAPRYVFFAASAEYARTAMPDANPGPFERKAIAGEGLGLEGGVTLMPWLDLFVGVDVASVTVTPRNLSAFASTTSGFSDRASLRHIEGGARFRLPLAPRFAPYVEAGYSRRRMHYKSDYTRDYAPGSSYSTTGGPAFETEEKGTAPLLGLGVESAVSHALTVDLGLRSSSGHYDERTLWLDGVFYPDHRPAPTARTTRVHAGVRWYPTVTGVRR